MSLNINIDIINSTRCTLYEPRVDTIIKNYLKRINIQKSSATEDFTKYKFIGRGNFSEVYENDNIATKVSFILQKFINETSFSSSETSILNYFDNVKYESLQYKSYSSLKKFFPECITQFYNSTHAYYKNSTLPVKIIKMEYINGICFNTFIKTNENVTYLLEIISQLIQVLLNSNLMGYFHNDIAFRNILIKDNNNAEKYLSFITDIKLYDRQTTKIPVLIDYSFSKKILTKYKYPIECAFILSEITYKLEKYNPSFLKNIALKNLIDLFNVLNEKYEIFSTNFCGKLITGNGNFTKIDYLILPKISKSDVLKINECVSIMHDFIST